MSIQIVVLLLFGWTFQNTGTFFNSYTAMVTNKSNLDSDNGDQLVIIIKPGLDISYRSGSFFSSSGLPLDSLNELLNRYQAKVIPMLRNKEDENVNNSALSTLANTYFIYPGKGSLKELADQLKGIDVIDAAYIKPESEEPEM